MTQPFQQLLAAAAAQPRPQRLLFVFAASQLPESATESQRAAYARGTGGSLTPLMCVDKSPGELARFEDLVSESRNAGPEWAVVFVGGLDVNGPAESERPRIDAALKQMIDAIASGEVRRFLAFSPQGELLTFV